MKKWIFVGLLGIGIASAQTALAKSTLIKIDGSSTVFPITEAVAEEFQTLVCGVIGYRIGIRPMSKRFAQEIGVAKTVAEDRRRQVGINASPPVTSTKQQRDAG